MTHEEYRKGAFSNNTFDFKALNESLKELKETSFDFLYNIQKDSISFKRFDFKMKDFLRKDRSHYSLFINTSFILRRKRTIYKKSDFYKQMITRDAISSNTDIFTFNYIAFINGKLSKLFNVVCHEGVTEFVLPIRSKLNPTGVKRSVFNTLMEMNASVTIIITQNTKDVINFSKVEDLFKLDTFHSVITLTPSDNYFSLEPEPMPFPIENIMVLKYGNNAVAFDHETSLKMYYPNIYELVNEKRNYSVKVVIFYRNDENFNYRYRNELSLFHKYTANIVELYKDKSIPDIIRDYKPQEFIYTEKDFETNYYGAKTELEYKADKLKEWINVNPEVVIPYLKRQIFRNRRFFIQLANISLEDRIRTNNFNEITDETQRKEFDFPRYLFKFSNIMADGFWDFRFFIDGIFYVADEFYSDKKYQYFYVPITKVNENSVIELEKFYPFEYHKEVEFDVDHIQETIEIESDGLGVYANDVFLTDRETKYIDKDGFLLETNVDGIDISFPSSKDSFCNIAKANVTILDASLYNTPLDIYIKKVSYYGLYMTQADIDHTEAVVFDVDTSRDARHIRVFRNGRILPPRVYNIDFSPYMNGNTSVSVNMSKKKGDVFVVDATPNKYIQVYYAKNISEKGYVDLTGILDKPMDTRWYDVYVNGRKLSEKNIECITATKFFIQGISSRLNLDIYERDRDEEYFSIGENSLNELLLQNIDGFFDKIMDGKETLDDIEDDILLNIISDIDNDVMNFYYVFMVGMFINPDLDQITEDMKKTFPELFIIDEPFFINPDVAPDAFTVLEINGDQSHEFLERDEVKLDATN